MTADRAYGPPSVASFVTGLTWQDFPHDVARRAVLCIIDTLGAMLVGRSARATREEAQFSLAWPIAALILDRQVGPDQVLDPALSSAAHTELRSRVEARVSRELTRLYDLSERNDPAGKDAAVVTLTLTDGRVLSSGLVEHVLYPEPGWAEAEVELELATDVADLMARLASALLPA
jgi:2-methylcitrate dehydratase PrpD